MQGKALTYEEFERKYNKIKKIIEKYFGVLYGKNFKIKFKDLRARTFNKMLIDFYNKYLVPFGANFEPSLTLKLIYQNNFDNIFCRWPECKKLRTFNKNSGGYQYLKFCEEHKYLKNEYKKIIQKGQKISKETIQKRKKTCLQKYGVENPMQNDEIRLKASETIKETIKNKNEEELKEWHKKISEAKKGSKLDPEHKEKISKTLKEFWKNNDELKKEYALRASQIPVWSKIDPNAKEKIKLKISESVKQTWANKPEEEKISHRLKVRRFWQELSEEEKAI